MKRVAILIMAFLASLSLVTLAYSAELTKEALNPGITNLPGSECTVGSQNPATVANNAVDGGGDQCGRYNGYVQGVCCCNPTNGQLECLENPICREAIGQRQQ